MSENALSPGSSATDLPLVDGRVELAERRVVRGDQVAPLRAKELELLAYLAARPGRTVSREELFAAVWGYHPGTRSRTLDTTIRRLRAAIEADPAAPRHLLTEVGVGYRFVAAAPADAAERLLQAGAERVRALLTRRAPARVVLVGPPGVGKRRWVTEAAAAFPGRVVRASGDGLGPIALALGIDPGGDPERLRRRIEAARAPGVLLVLDDVPLDAFVRWAPPAVTATTAPPPDDPRYEVVRVDPLPRDAARDLLLRGASGRDLDVDPLLDQLGGLPLAIELAAGQLAFASPAALVAELLVHPERLFDGAPDTALRAATAARARLASEDRAALDALAAFAGPVPSPVMAEAAGGVGRLARLRDLGWLAPTSIGWAVPASLRPPAEPAARERAAEALVRAYADRYDPLVGPHTFEARAELVALVPTLRPLADDPRVRGMLCWALLSAGAPEEAGRLADTLAEALPIAAARLGLEGPAQRLALVEGLPESPERDAVRARLLRQCGRLDEAAALPEPSGSGSAAGEVWLQRHQIAAIRWETEAADRAAREALRAWRRKDVLEERARACVASLALLRGEVARAAREYELLAASPDPGGACEAELGLGFVSLVRGDPDGARRAADRAEARLPTLGDALAVGVWHQIATLRREVGDGRGVAAAVAHGLTLNAASAGPATLTGGLRCVLGASLLDAGDLAGAEVELVAASEVFARLGLVERQRFAEVLLRAARELRGETASAAWSGLPHDGDSRVDHLIAAYAGRPRPDSAAFARRYADVAVTGVLAAMGGDPRPAGAACLFEVRLGARIAAHRAR